jgi:hypothetical protein
VIEKAIIVIIFFVWLSAGVVGSAKSSLNLLLNGAAHPLSVNLN